MFNDTHFKVTNTKPLIYRFVSCYIYANVVRIS